MDNSLIFCAGGLLCYSPLNWTPCKHSSFIIIHPLKKSRNYPYNLPEITGAPFTSLVKKQNYRVSRRNIAVEETDNAVYWFSHCSMFSRLSPLSS